MLLIREGTQNVSLVMRLQDALNGSPKTGVPIANLRLRAMWVENDNDVYITSWQTLTPLASLTADYACNAAYEAGEGYYRIDVAQDLFAAGTVFAVVLIKDGVNDSVLVARREIQVVPAKYWKAAQMLVNKAVQDKLTGAIDYYDDDGSTKILTHTPTDGESTITRTPS